MSTALAPHRPRAPTAGHSVCPSRSLLCNRFGLPPKTTLNYKLPLPKYHHRGDGCRDSWIGDLKYDGDTMVYWKQVLGKPETRGKYRCRGTNQRISSSVNILHHDCGSLDHQQITETKSRSAHTESSSLVDGELPFLCTTIRRRDRSMQTRIADRLEEEYLSTLSMNDLRKMHLLNYFKRRKRSSNSKSPR